MALMSPYVRDSHDRSADINSMSHLPDKATNRHQPYIRLREEGARDDCSHRTIETETSYPHPSAQ